MGEASNLGPVDDQLALAADDSMGVVSASEFDLTRLDSDLASGSDSSDHKRSELTVGGNAEEDVRARPIIGSDTESVDTAPLAVDAVDSRQNGQHRRLRLRWSAFASEQPTMHRDARAVQGFFNDLARRVGSVPRKAQLPRAIQRQRWSPVNVPLLWRDRSSS